MLENLKTSQSIQLTVKRVPRREDEQQTIARLMRQDADIKAGLRRTQRNRERNTIVRSRGKRPWAMRIKRTLVARVEEGATWNMHYFPQLRNDLASVAEYLDIKPA